jgi:TM2 domain-containing membrane protein YozV
MKKAIKAALFNALLFPGWGQIYLKQYKKGVFIISAVMAGTLSILWYVIQATRDILKITPFKKGTVTFEAVLRLAIKSLAELNLDYILPLLLFMFLLWIFSIIDNYESGKKLVNK